MSYDVIVLGLGGMGSAAAYHLARRGQRVLGLDRHRAAHDQGSSHGHSRIIREAYWEHPSYVPLVRRAYDLWVDLERASGMSLLRITGGINISLPNSPLIAGCLESAGRHGLAHEILDAAAIRRRFPAFAPSDDRVGVYESRAGVLDPETCVRAHLQEAARAGADLHHEEPAIGWHSDGIGVEVQTPRGRYSAGRLVVAPGPWAPSVLADLGLPLVIERQVVVWFRPARTAGAFDPDRCPIYLWQIGPRLFYGFPRIGGHEIKIAEHATGHSTTAETIERDVEPRELEDLRQRFVSRYMPLANGEIVATGTCMYTMTPDTHFIVDHHSHHANVVVACGFSGHGFKFVPVIGEMLAELTLDGATRLDATLLSVRRFATAR